MQSTALRAVKHYGRVGVVSAVESATPHRLIQMLLDGALTRITSAKVHMRRGEIARKGECIGLAISIIETLRASLDHEAGGAIAENLEELYGYMLRRLLVANAHDDESILDEVHGLVSEIKAGWDAIAPGTDAPRAVVETSA